MIMYCSLYMIHTIVQYNYYKEEVECGKYIILYIYYVFETSIYFR